METCREYLDLNWRFCRSSVHSSICSRKLLKNRARRKSLKKRGSQVPSKMRKGTRWDSCYTVQSLASLASRWVEKYWKDCERWKREIKNPLTLSSRDGSFSSEFRASRAVVFGFLTKLADTVVRRIPPSREFPNFSKCWTLACFGWLSAVEMPTKDDWMASCAKLINSTTLSACLACPGERSVAWWEFAAIRDMRVSRILF